MSKQQEKTTDGVEYLEVLFPGETIDMGHGYVVNVRPLSLENLKEVITAFNKIVDLYREGKDASAMIFVAFEEVMELLPLCIDKSMSEIPSGFAPELLEAFIRQNLAHDVVGKWTALVRTLTEEIPKLLKEKSPDQSLSKKEALDTK